MEESGVHEPRVLTAWRKTLTPAIDFICTCQGMSAPDDPLVTAH